MSKPDFDSLGSLVQAMEESCQAEMDGCWLRVCVWISAVAKSSVCGRSRLSEALNDLEVHTHSAIEGSAFSFCFRSVLLFPGRGATWRAPSGAVKDGVSLAHRRVPHGADPRMSTGASQTVQPLSHHAFIVKELGRKMSGIPAVVKVEFWRILGNRKKAHYFQLENWAEAMPSHFFLDRRKKRSIAHKDKPCPWPLGAELR